MGHRCWPYKTHSLLAQQHGVQSRYILLTVVEYTLILKMAQKQQVRPRPLWQNFFHRLNQWIVKLVFWRRFIQVVSGHCGKVLWNSGRGWILRFYSPQSGIGIPQNFSPMSTDHLYEASSKTKLHSPLVPPVEQVLLQRSGPHLLLLRHLKC